MNRWMGTALFALFGLALALGSASAHPAAWGVNLFAFLPTAFGLGVGVLLLAALVPGVAARLGRGVLRIVGAVQHNPFAVLLVAGVATALFVVARLRFQFLGDGQLWVDLIEQGKEVHHFEPLSGILVGAVARLIDATHPEDHAGAVSIAAGALAVMVTARFAATLWSVPARAALTWALLLCNPLALLWFGYVESYPVVLLLQVCLAWALVRCVRGAFPVWGVGLLMVLVNASHILTVGWWPCLIVLLWWRQRRDNLPQTPWLALAGRTLVLLTLVVAAVLLLWWSLGVSPSGILERLRSDRGVQSLSLAWIFSPTHGIDVLNEVTLLLAPAILLAGGSLVRGAAWRRFPATPEGSTLLALLPGPLLILLLVPPLLGGARDWDLHVTLVLPLVVWAVDLWGQVQVAVPAGDRIRSRKRPAAGDADPTDFVLAGRAVALALAWCIAWVAIPLDAARGARHMQALQEPRGTFHAFARAQANEALGIYYRSRDAQREHAAWVRATQADPYNPRYHINRANAALKLERIEEAQQQFEQALERGFDEWHVYYNLGVCGLQLGEPARAEERFTQLIEKYPNEWRGWGGRGEARLALKRPAEALTDLQRLVEMQPRFARGQQMLGMAYHALGQEEAARAAWQRALELDPSDQVSRRALQGS